MVIEQSTVDTIGFVSTVGGIVLAVLALVLSILFYRWADTQAKDSEKTLVELRTATDGLGQVVKTLRDESFTLLKSAYTDMGELAKFGVQRDSASPAGVEVSVATDSDTTPTSTTNDLRNKFVTSEQTDEELFESAGHFLAHFVERRGSNYALSLKQLFDLIRNVVDGLPRGGVMSGDEIAAQLASEGFDQEEVLFGLAMMAQVGRLVDL